MATATLLSTDVSNWPPTTQHYSISDGTWILVEVDESGPTAAMQAYVLAAVNREPEELIPRPIEFMQRPTVILPADGDGFAISLEPLHRFAPGTTHTDALTQAGFEVI